MAVAMRDKRTVDQLDISELERILALKKREARQAQLRRLKAEGRVIEPNGQAEPDNRQADGREPASGDLYSDPNGLPAQTVTAGPGMVRPATPHFEEDVEPPAFAKRKNETEQRIWRTFVDRSLTLIEVLAVVGLVALGIGMFQSISQLQSETAAVQAEADELLRAAMPTPEPTPQLQLITDLVLPGGHTPPIDGNSSFNFSELPEGLEYLAVEQVYIPTDFVRPTPAPQQAHRIRIPQIGVDAPIVQGVDWEALKLGVGQLPNGVAPRDTDGNLVLAAHNDIYGEIFRRLDELEPGMRFEVVTNQRVYTYEIREWIIVEPDAVHVMQSQGRPMATLISCYPYQVNTQRIVVFADRVDV